MGDSGIYISIMAYFLENIILSQIKLVHEKQLGIVILKLADWYLLQEDTCMRTAARRRWKARRT